ncbi:MAG TPA: ATP-binding cassette domain-containing protein [Mobilitalea sp.]|nr:ATP-binding cassette domain-containing protein [Mobilitalea sp.]
MTADLILKQQDAKASSLVSAYDLSFGYTEELLFQGLTFQIQKGDRLWIRGRNGAGKSTLLRIISKNLPCERVQYAENITMETAFQEPLWTKGYLQDYLVDNEVRNLFFDICHRLDLKHEVLKRPLETFSSGELKKIDLARALASPCQLLLLDEPLNFMDIYFREQLEKAILSYQPTVVFVEHDEHFGNQVATGEIRF